MDSDRWKPNMGEIFKGDKPEYIAPAINSGKIIDILLGQLEVLRMLTCPAIYIPLKGDEKDRKP